MDTNIFNGIKYGDKFLTRDGRLTIYLRKEREGRWFILSNGTQFLVQTEYGNCLTNDIYQLDIVSRYHGEIDEEKIEELAEKCYEPIMPINDWIDAFKAGYRKAKEC